LGISEVFFKRSFKVHLLGKKSSSLKPDVTNFISLLPHLGTLFFPLCDFQVKPPIFKKGCSHKFIFPKGSEEYIPIFQLRKRAFGEKRSPSFLSPKLGAPPSLRLKGFLRGVYRAPIRGFLHTPLFGGYNPIPLFRRDDTLVLPPHVICGPPEGGGPPKFFFLGGGRYVRHLIFKSGGAKNVCNRQENFFP